MGSVIAFLRGLPGLKRAASPDDADEEGEDGSAPAAAAAAAEAGPSSSAAAAAGGGSNGSCSSSRASQHGKVLVFAHHQAVLDGLEANLARAEGIGYIRIDGSTSSTQRQVRSGPVLSGCGGAAC